MRLVLLESPGGSRDRDREAPAAAAWAMASGFEVATGPRAEGDALRLDARDVVWCHAVDDVPSLPATWAGALRAWVTSGGRVLLTGLATPLAAALGAPDEAPQLQRTAAWRHADDPLWDAGFRDWPGYPHVRGVQGWGAHPLFDGMQRGTYTWGATEGEPVARSVFVAPQWPTGHVIGVDRAYVRLDAATAVAWEYEVGEGRILCLGANVSFTARDRRLVPQRDRYLMNAIASLDPRRAAQGGRRTWWPHPRRGDDAAPTLEPSPGVPALPPAGALSGAPLQMLGEPGDGAPFTVAGRRALVVGDERLGVRECWIHPLCVLSDGLRLTADGEALRAESVRVTPGAVQRTLVDARGGRWREVVAVSLDQAIVHVEYAPLDAGGHATLVVEGTLRLRLQWPYPGDALQPLAVAVGTHGDSAHSVRVRAFEGRAEARLAVEGAAEVHGVSDAGAPSFAATGRPGAGLRLAVVASAGGDLATDAAWRSLAATPLATTLRQRAQDDETRRRETVRLATPSSALDSAWEWAKARLASFVVDVPGVGTGFAAGYAATRPGWGDSRPGYAWFFGRDACWSGDALLAAGMFREARIALEFLATTSDVTGKIAHEVTTSGVAHYDAADATPLWLRLVAAYAEWTGDLATVRAHWEQVRAAFACVSAHDRDGDGLPENTGEGHGWVESGPLGGGAVTSYVAATWIDALRRLAPVAHRVGDAGLHARVTAALERAVSAFARRLRDPATGRVILQLSEDGSPVTDLTALSSVPVLLGVDEGASADAVVRALASTDFAPPWGVRMIPRHDARYRARGYHCGAVWPLYTGWASLAAFRRASPDEGWRHLASVAACAFARERGAFDEVLDGDSGDAAGICPDQAWSAAMVIAPFMQGMLGIRPQATDRRCTLAPCWPSDWQEARVDGVRVGNSRFSLAMRRIGDGAEAVHRYRLQLECGPALAVAFANAEGAPVVSLDGDPVELTLRHAVGGAHGRR